MYAKQLTTALWLGGLTLFCLFPMYAQSSLNGKVVDSKKLPLPGASVLLLNAVDSSLANGEISGEDGTFRIGNISGGAYLLKVTMVGFEDFQTDTFQLENTGNQRWPDVILQESAEQLKEVQVLAKRPLYEQKIDRMMINVAASSINAGGNALEVLQRSPGVIVNRQSNSISMSGKQGVIIMVNGKITPLPPDAIIAMLEGMQADNIERIELIHTPPASFDAQGSAGIINIVLKQTADAGLNGGYSINGGYGKREKYGASLNLNFRKGKINLFGNYSLQFDHNPQVFTNYRGIRKDGNFIETDGSSDRSPDLYNQNGRFGADYQLTPKTVIGVVGTYFDRYWDMEAETEIFHRTNGLQDSTTRMFTTEINHWNSLAGNFNVMHKFNDKQNLSFDADYIYYKIHNPSDYSYFTVFGDGSAGKEQRLRLSKETPIKIAVAKSDYTQTFGENTQLEAGIKATQSTFDNDVRVENLLQEVWTADSLFTSRFMLTEDIAAAYGTVSFKLNAKTDLKIGLRYEYTSTHLGAAGEPAVYDRQYGSFFPSVFLLRNINENQSINLSYSRRIFRPGFTQLAPYLIFYDPSTVQGGNPSLQPAFVHAIRTDYRYKIFNLTLEYNLEKQSIRDLPHVDVEQNSTFLYPENNGKTHTAYAMINFPLHPAKWWDMQTTAFIAYQKFDMEIEGERLKIPSKFIGLFSSHSFKLPKQFSIELSGQYFTANNSGVTKYKDNGQLNFGIQKDLGERWGKLSLNVTDIFTTNNYFGTTDQPELNLLVKSSYQQAERVFMLTWSNRFGNKKLKDARQRSGGAEEERRRL
ncbi:MAG: TonB-dependent receptor [Lewinellaceae bacterium]|nr:TonB-dependent receptor [Saprospiraceae bacterium]MCB9340285.1 TonB-dependent receptor [Lewinellaceae bacterium]